MVKNILLVCLILIPVIIYYQLFLNRPVSAFQSILINGQKFNLEIARTMSQKSTGLMNRDYLCPDCGMIFISDRETTQVFWMKNTRIPLDIIFLDKNGQVINLVTADPELTTSDFQLKTYRSLKPSQYVIELNAGLSTKLNLTPGDKINLPSFN